MQKFRLMMLALFVLLISACASKSNTQVGQNASVTNNVHELVVAIKAQDLALVEKLLARGHSPDFATASGMYPIHHAVYVNNIELTKALVDAGADLNASDDYNNRVLYFAALKKSDVEIIELLLASGAKLNLDPGGNEFLFNGLSQAIFLKNYEQVAAMVAGGVELNFIFDVKLHQTPLLYTIIAKDRKMTRLLLAGRPNVNISTFDGVSPLSMAIFQNDEELVRLLVEAGADCSQKLSDSKSTYQFAKSRDHDALLPLMPKCHRENLQ